MAHLIDRLIALWAWLEPGILKHPGWLAFCLGLNMLIGWRLLRWYVGFVARGSVIVRHPHPHSRTIEQELTTLQSDLTGLRSEAQAISRLMEAHDHPVENILPQPSTLRPGMVLIWNGRAWVGHPTVMAEHQPIVRKARGKGKKSSVEIDRPPTAWERITEDDDAGPDQT